MKNFMQQMENNRVHKIDSQYVLMDKGDDWNIVKNEIEEMYNSWLKACMEINQSEADIIERVNNPGFKIEKEINQDGLLTYQLQDEKGIIGQQFILLNDEEILQENRLNMCLLFLFISSKSNEKSRRIIQDFVKEEIVI